MLRGKQPTDRNPNETIFNNIEDCDDVWTQLLYTIVGKNNNGSVIYWGGNRNHKFKNNFYEIRVKCLNDYKTNVNPDVIFARGGFSEYHSFLSRYKKSFKIYYGAGKRFLPQKGFYDYNLILVDSKEQLLYAKQKFPNIPSELLIKPAPDNIMFYNNSNKIFDICFPANGSQHKFKGHKFVFNSIPSEYKVLNLGNNSGLVRPENITIKRVLRKNIAQEYNKCKIGIVCCENNIDSCPRVIPEMLSCGLPIVVLKGLHFNSELYINEKTGILSDKCNFWENVKYLLDNISKYDPKKYYDENLTLKHSSCNIKEKILNITNGVIDI